MAGVATKDMKWHSQAFFGESVMLFCEAWSAWLILSESCHGLYSVHEADSSCDKFEVVDDLSSAHDAFLCGPWVGGCRRGA